jgi:uncharacterized membrane protein
VYEWALLLHLVGAIVFFAGLVVATVGALAARRRTRPSEVALLLGTARWGVPLVGVGAVLALAAGFWLLEETAYGLEGWVVASLVLLAVSAVAGGLGGQGPKRARQLAERLAAEGDLPDAGLQAQLRRPSADALNVVAAIAAVAILVLMVFKPGA